MSMTIQERIAVLQAIEKNPKVLIQYKNYTGEWCDLGSSSEGGLNFAGYDYRIKPEPRVIYVLYNNQNKPCASTLHCDSTPQQLKDSYERNYPAGKPFKLVEFGEKID